MNQRTPFILAAVIGATMLGIVGCTDAVRTDALVESDARLDPTASIFNLDHLDHLGEEIAPEIARRAAVEAGLDEPEIRIVHIYADAPSYEWTGDSDEGIACVDDAARAAVVYLRHFELTGDRESLTKGKALVRFVMYMQNDDGLFYNFVFDNELTINKTHQNSTAEEFGWWAARGVWVLGTAADILKEEDPAFSQSAAERIQKTYPYLRAFLSRTGEMTSVGDREYPTWLIGEYGSDSTSELLLGLTALNSAYPEEELTEMIAGFASGIARMQFGSMNAFPYGAHASYPNEWHGWGNSQTQALSQAGFYETARREADHFYPRLLTEKWRHSLVLDDSTGGRDFEQIAYAVRGVAVGLARLSSRTNDARYAKMAGLAASWFTGNNVAGVRMYDPETGRGFDGINSAETVNRNSGAESTIEALMTILEIEQLPEAQAWMYATAGASVRVSRNDKEYMYRIFATDVSGRAHRLGVVMDLTAENLLVLENDELQNFLQN